MAERMKGPSQRQLRLGETVRKALADIFLKTDIRDPALHGVILSVSEVSISPDMRNAKVYFSVLNEGDGEAQCDALNHHSKFIRGELARIVRMKYMPELHFELDRTLDQSAHIDEILRSPKVAKDLAND